MENKMDELIKVKHLDQLFFRVGNFKKIEEQNIQKMS